MQEVIKKIGLTAEILGYPLSAQAIAVMAADLSSYPASDVLAALETCRKTLKSRLNLSSIIDVINSQDGHLSANEAWALALKSRDEYSTIVWTDEIAFAFGAASELLKIDEIGARMAFKEAYERNIAEARAKGVKAKYNVSMGISYEGRADAIRQAVEEGKLKAENYKNFLPAPPTELLEGPKLTEEEIAERKEKFKSAIKQISEMFAVKENNEAEERAARIEAERKKKADIQKLIEDHENAKAKQRSA